VISNGPFWLARYDPPAQFAELRAFRDETLPLPPRRALPRAGRDAGHRAAGGPHGAHRRSEAAGDRASTAPAAALRYLLFDAALAEVVASGAAEDPRRRRLLADVRPGGDGGLFPGLYHLYLAASSDALALISERRLDVEVVP
jgi:peptide/nickel transport system substrate-binding protein